MKNKHVFWGLLLISLGFFILVNNITSYDFYFREVWKIWPLVLILWGISLIIRQAAIRSILIALTAVVLSLAIYSSVRTGFRFFNNEFNFNVDEEDYSDPDFERHSFTEKFNNQQHAVLNFDAGAGSFIIEETSGELFEASTEGFGNNFSLQRDDSGSESTIDFIMHKKRFSIRDGKFKNKVVMKLNPAPIWDINLNVGAAGIDLDFSEYKINKLDIEMGAASLNLKLGEPEKESFVRLDGGVSSIDIVIPENVACEIKTDVSLSSRNFSGFEKVNDDLYRTNNFDNAGKKIFLDLTTGVSSITVKRSSTW